MAGEQGKQGCAQLPGAEEEEQVALLHVHEARDGAAVEADAIFQRLGKVACQHGDVLLETEADGASWHVPDHYYVLGDLESYVQAKLKVNADYKDKLAFAKKSWLNIANAGKFSSDRTIKDYAENIWKIEPVKL